MTLTSSTVRLSYNGDGSTTSFSVTFVFWEKDDLRVILRDADGAESVWTRGTEYTVTGGDGSTGTVEVETSPTDFTPASGETLVILSNVPNTQLTSFPLGGPFPSTSAEQELDKTNRRVQQQEEELGRSLKFSETSPDSGVAFPDVTGNASKLPRVKSDESGLEMVGVETFDGLTVPVETGDLAGFYDTRSDITTASLTSGTKFIRTAGYSTVGDGGGALYKRVGSEPSHALKVQSGDGVWWEIAEPQVITFQACGGVEGDDSGNGAGNVTAFDNFISYIQDGFSGENDAKGPSLYFPIIDGSGVYHFDDHLNVKAAVHITGPGGWHWAARDAGPKLVFPVDNHGLIVHHYTTIDDGTEASGFTAAGSIIENLALKGGGPGETTGHGVWVRGFCTLRHLFVEDFAEDGFHIVGTIGNGGSDEGNVSTAKVENCTADGNGRHGFLWDGGDANACNNFGNEARDNGRWGFLDSSFLGNAHTGYHERRNGLAGVGGNGSGESSYVHVNNGGTDERYYAVLGASEADLVANQPSTNDAVWRYHKDGGSTSTIPTWQSSQPEGTYFVGGPYASDNANARNTFFGCYAEKSGGPPQMDEPAVVVGGHGMDEVVGGALYIGAGTDVPFIQTDNDFEFRVGRVLTVDGDHGTPRIELADSSDNKVYIVENGGLDLRTDAAINSVTFQDFGQSAGLASFTVRRATSTGGAGTVEDIASSTGNTGGSGSAGAGSQYVEINIDGTTFKVLHDGTL